MQPIRSRLAAKINSTDNQIMSEVFTFGFKAAFFSGSTISSKLQKSEQASCRGRLPPRMSVGDCDSFLVYCLRMKNGIQRTFYPTGSVETEVPYVNGVVHGVSRAFHPNGLVAHEIPMVEGYEEGIATFWNDKGEVLGTYEIRNGTGTQKMWFPSGKLMGEVPLVNRMMMGRQVAYFEDGTVAAETYYVRNQQVTKKKYMEACASNPSLPRYADEVLHDRPRK